MKSDKELKEMITEGETEKIISELSLEEKKRFVVLMEEIEKSEIEDVKPEESEVIVDSGDHEFTEGLESTSIGIQRKSYQYDSQLT